VVDSMGYEIKVVGEDDYEYNIDEIAMVTIENNLGQRFMFKPGEMKSMELIITNEPPIAQ